MTILTVYDAFMTQCPRRHPYYDRFPRIKSRLIQERKKLAPDRF